MDKLDFEIEPHDSFLQALIPDGFVHISDYGDSFKVRAFYMQESVDIAEASNIYEALDKANEWWEGTQG